MMTPVNVLVEGITDEPVAKKLLKHVGLDIGTVYGRKGKSHLLERIHNYTETGLRIDFTSLAIRSTLDPPVAFVLS